MDRSEIRVRVLNIISKVANLDAGRYDDEASFTDDLELDSLTMLEIAVDVDYEFQLNMPDGELPTLNNLREAVDLVEQILLQRRKPVEGCADVLLSQA